MIDPVLVDRAVALFDSARAGNCAELAAAFDDGVPVNLTDGNGNSYLMLAAYHGHADAVALLIARGANIDKLNTIGQSPLAGTVFKRHTGVARILVDAGADPDLGVPSARVTAELYGSVDFDSFI
ncbi:MAG: ankyrin repeat domain-containing protein [Rhodococcus fascians]